jgi:membrane protein involved in colicin uptake
LIKPKKDIIKKKQAEEKAAKTQEQKAAKDARAAAAKEAGAAAGGGEPKGVLDNLIDGMKSGEAFANKPKVGRGRGVGLPGPPGGPGGPGGKPGANVAGEALMMFSKLKAVKK